MKLVILLCFMVTGGNALAGSADSNLNDILNQHVFSPEAKNKFELPKRPEAIEAAINEIRATLAGKPLPVNQSIGTQILAKGYSVEIQPSGDCDAIASANCKVTIIGRKQVDQMRLSLSDEVNRYTEDLRYPNDKNFSVHGTSVERHHFEISDGKALKIAREMGPMKIGMEYRIKKCRNALFVSWKCNTVSYELYKLAEGAFFLLGRQVHTTGEPTTYLVQGCKTNCKNNFNSSQRVNASSGSMAMVLFQNGKIYDVSVGTDDSTSEARKILVAQDSISEGAGVEYNVLVRKIFGNNPPPTQRIVALAPTQTKEDNHPFNSFKMKIFGLIMGCFLGLLSSYYGISYYIRLIEGNKN